jgi:hypothetical protein
LQCAVEFGPGAVLSGLVKRIDARMQCWPTGQAAAFQAALEYVEEGA